MQPKLKQTSKAAKYLFYIGLGFLSVPVLILGSTILEIDESGLGTVTYFVIVGLPAAFIALVLMISSVVVNLLNK